MNQGQVLQVRDQDGRHHTFPFHFLVEWDKETGTCKVYEGTELIAVFANAQGWQIK
jgi:hypothetical protein